MNKIKKDEFPKSNFTRKLSDRDRDIFLKMMEEPPKPNESLKKAVRKYKKRIEDKTLISDIDKTL